MLPIKTVAVNYAAIKNKAVCSVKDPLQLHHSNDFLGTGVYAVGGNNKFGKGFIYGITRALFGYWQFENINNGRELSQKRWTSTDILDGPIYRGYKTAAPIFGHFPFWIAQHKPRSFPLINNVKLRLGEINRGFSRSRLNQSGIGLLLDEAQRPQRDSRCDACYYEARQDSSQWWPWLRFFLGWVFLGWGGWVVYDDGRWRGWYRPLGFISYGIGWFGLLFPYGW